MTSVQHVTLQDDIGFKEFDGYLLADTTTDDDNREGQQQWTELEVWLKTDLDGNKTGYVFRSIGKSVVFHRIDGCRRGLRINVADVPGNLEGNSSVAVGDLEPCRWCRPPEFGELRAAGIDRVKLEVDRPRVRMCTTAQELVDLLKNPPRRHWQNKHDGGELSDVARHLLQEAAEYDDEIRELFTSVTQI